MIKFYFKNQKAITYTLAVIAFIAGCIVPDKLFAKAFCFGFAGGAFLIAILNRMHQMKKASTVAGSEKDNVWIN